MFEPSTHVAFIERGPDRCREHEPEISPFVASGKPFLKLPHAAFSQGGDSGRWHRQGASTSLRLWLDNLKPAIYPLELSLNTHAPLIEFNIVPPQSERLSLLQAHCRRNRHDSFEAMATHSLQELLSLFGIQRLNVRAHDFRRIHQCRDIPHYQPHRSA